MESCFFISSLYEYNLIDKERTFHQKKEKKSKNKYYLKNVNSSFVQIMIFEFLPKKKYLNYLLVQNIYIIIYN